MRQTQQGQPEKCDDAMRTGARKTKKESATRSSNMRDKCAMHKTNTAWGSQMSQDFEEHKTSGEQIKNGA